MSQRGLESRLPVEIREWLEAELLRRGFADYAEVTEQLNGKLQAAGETEAVSKSAVHRYGQTIEERCEALRRTTAIARTLQKEVGDDEGAMTDATIRLVQDKLFNIVLDLEIDPAKINITSLGRVIADLGRASVMQKKHQVAIRAAVEAKLTALETQTKTGKSRLDPETLAAVREAVIGVL